MICGRQPLFILRICSSNTVYNEICILKLAESPQPFETTDNKHKIMFQYCVFTFAASVHILKLHILQRCLESVCKSEFCSSIFKLLSILSQKSGTVLVGHALNLFSGDGAPMDMDDSYSLLNTFYIKSYLLHLGLFFLITRSNKPIRFTLI